MLSTRSTSVYSAMAGASRLVRHAVMYLALALALGCASDSLTSNLPDSIVDPDATNTPAGALTAYRGALVRFRRAFAGHLTDPQVANDNASFVATTGLLSDELQTDGIGAPIGTRQKNGRGLVDSRTLPEYADPTVEPVAPYQYTYSALQATRGEARAAMGLLNAYVPHATALPGHLYAVTGYTEVFLAELFCSGIPLSTVDHGGNYTLKPGSATDDVYTHAITMFDSALALATDSARIMNLARIGKARALLNLGRAAEAAQAVAGVPDGFQYVVAYAGGTNLENFTVIPGNTTWFATVANAEGGTGLGYVTSNDPRAPVVSSGRSNMYGVTILFPGRYSGAGQEPVVLADWVEARLIEAEAALEAGDTGTWLAKLNHLRQTAITPALPDTTDPGPDAAGTNAPRVDLLFRERAFWLFLTGHRQGDLRRLVRHYERMPDTVYPTGAYQGENGIYGNAIDAPIPATERAFNPLFTGCLSRGA